MSDQCKLDFLVMLELFFQHLRKVHRYQFISWMTHAWCFVPSRPHVILVQCVDWVRVCALPSSCPRYHLQACNRHWYVTTSMNNRHWWCSTCHQVINAWWWACLENKDFDLYAMKSVTYTPMFGSYLPFNFPSKNKMRYSK